MTPATAALAAATAQYNRIKEAAKNSDGSAASLVPQIEGRRAAMTMRARAEALGEACTTDQPAAGEIPDLEARLAGYQEAGAILRRQLPAAEAAVAAAEQAVRAEQGAHVRHVVIPPLFSAAQEAGAAFSRAMAELAAAEDLSLQLQRRKGEAYVTGAAGSLLTTMGTAASVGTFCEAGAARGAYDWPGYSETSRRIEDELRELAA